MLFHMTFFCKTQKMNVQASVFQTMKVDTGVTRIQSVSSPDGGSAHRDDL